MVSKRDVLNALKTMTFGEVTVGDVVVTPEDFEEFIDSSYMNLWYKESSSVAPLAPIID